MKVRVVGLSWLLVAAGCSVATPVVDRLPEEDETFYDNLVIACRMPGPCRDEPRDLENALTELRPLRTIGCDESGCKEPSTDLFGEDPGSAARPATLMMEGVRWTSGDIAIETDEPFEIVLSGAHVGPIRIDLNGPVTLRFINETTVMGAQLSSASAASRLGFDHATTAGVSIGDGEQPFAGDVEALHTTFEQASMNVDRADFDSVVSTESFIASDALISRDGALRDVVLELGSGLFAPTLIEKVTILRCRDLSFFGSRLDDVVVPRCTGEATRIYESTVVRATVDGTINADTSKLEAIRFGQHEPTSVLGWGTTIRQSTFCDMVEDVKIERSAACNACSEAFAEEAEVCNMPLEGAPARTGGDAGVQNNFCEALDNRDTCTPRPDRPRPHAEATE